VKKFFFTSVLLLSLVFLAWAPRPKVKFQEMNIEQVEALLLSASQASPPMTIIEVLMKLSSQLVRNGERVIIKGDVWKEVLDRKKCMFGSYDSVEVTQLLPFHALKEIQFGATVRNRFLSPMYSDSWDAYLDPNHPEIKNGIFKGHIMNSKVEIGRSRKGERPLGMFGGMTHTYDPKLRSGTFQNIFGIVFEPHSFKEAWITGVGLVNGTQHTAYTSNSLAKKLDFSRLTPIQCKGTSLRQTFAWFGDRRN